MKLAEKPSLARLARALVRRSAAVLLCTALLMAMASSAFAADPSTRTWFELRARWEQLRPIYNGSPYVATPSTRSPYTTGSLDPRFVQDGLNAVNFSRYLAGLPDDVEIDTSYAAKAQYGAVLLARAAALGQKLSHEPVKPSDMSQAFYNLGYEATTSSNIGLGFDDLASFNFYCMDDSDSDNLSHVGHRRWLMNPPLKKTGMGQADLSSDTWAFDESRSTPFDYDVLTWPSEGLFPAEMFEKTTAWSITLNPAAYDWSAGTEGHTVTLYRKRDGRMWTFSSADTDIDGEYFNFDTASVGVGNCFIFRPDPDSVGSYQPGDAFTVTLSGGIVDAYHHWPTTVSYETTFTSIYAVPVSIAGTDRIRTAIEVSKKAYPVRGSVDNVIVATAYNWPDALGGSALAGALDAPILLTSPTSLSPGVAAEIARLGASKAFVLGGERAVSSKVETALDALSGVSVERVGGANRYATAALIASRTIDAKGPSYSGKAFVTTGANFPDALGASPLAAAKGWPIYLANPAAGTNAGLVATMRKSGVMEAVVLGGENVVSRTVAGAITANGLGSDRLWGADRYATAIEVAKYGVANAGLSWNKLAIATGLNFPDALAGGVLQGKTRSVMLLTPSLRLSTRVASALRSKKLVISEVRFLGGESALAHGVRYEVAGALK